MPTLARMHKTHRAESWWQMYPHVRVRVCHQHVRRGGNRPRQEQGDQQPSTDCAPRHVPVPSSQEAARYWWK